MKKKKSVKKKVRKEYWHKQAFLICADVFDTEAIFIINYSKKEAEKFLKKATGKNYKEFDWGQAEGYYEEGGHCLGCMCRLKGGFVVFVKAEKNRFRKFVSTLTHEVTHVVQYLLRDRRIPLIEDTEEVHSYLTEFFIRKALENCYD